MVCATIGVHMINNVQLLAYIWSTMCNYWRTYNQQCATIGVHMINNVQLLAYIMINNVQLLAYIWSTMCNYWPTYDQQYLIWFVYLFSKWKKCRCFSVWQLLLIWKLIRNRCKTVQLNLRSKSFFDSIIHYLWQKIK